MDWYGPMFDQPGQFPVVEFVALLVLSIVGVYLRCLIVFV